MSTVIRFPLKLPLRLVIHNGTLTKEATIRISTRQLSSEFLPKFETCVFFEEDSLVVSEYTTRSAAVKGHAEARAKYGV